MFLGSSIGRVAIDEELFADLVIDSDALLLALGLIGSLIDSVILGLTLVLVVGATFLVVGGLACILIDGVILFPLLLTDF